MSQVSESISESQTTEQLQQWFPEELRQHLPEILRGKGESRYCAVAVYPTGSRSAQILSVGGRVVLFDTLEIARNFLPQLGTGRHTLWSGDGETAFWPELDAQGISRADVVTGYDPYQLPGGMPRGIASETRGREWRCHVMWSHVFTDCGGNLARRSDGTLANVALGEPVW
jgi:hypothetical protein